MVVVVEPPLTPRVVVEICWEVDCVVVVVVLDVTLMTCRVFLLGGGGGVVLSLLGEVVVVGS